MLLDITAKPEASTPPGLRPRAAWHLRANAVVVAYLALTAGAVLARDVLPMPRWLAIHLLLLGAVTNAIVIWGEHFAAALLRVRSDARRRSLMRLAVLNVAVAGVLGGVAGDVPAVIVVAAGLLVAVVGEYVVALLLAMRRSLGGRFAGTVRFYVAAGVTLVAGIGFGTSLAVGWGSHGELHAAHVHANLLGWVALTVLGTLFTLWPTALRTRMVDGVMAAARRCFVATTIGLAVALTGFGLGWRPLAIAGLACYGVGAGLGLDPFVRTWRRKAPHDIATWSLASGVSWLVVGIAADIALLASAPSLAVYLERLDSLVPLLLAGFVGQVLLGALSYLLPVVLGAGPTGFRAVSAVLSRGWRTRLVTANVGVLLVVPPGPGWLDVLGWALLMAVLLAFVALAATALLQRRGTPPKDSGAPRASRPAAAGVALGLLLTAVPVGIALSGHTGGSAHPASYSGTATTQTVDVALVNMDIRPGVIEVPAGTHLRLVVTNHDSMRHDLAFPDGPATRMLARGESQSLDLGTVAQSLSGWCTVPGHKAAGMTLDIKVTGAASNHMNHGTLDTAGTPATADVHGQPGADWKPYDATLPPAPAATVHKLTLHARELVKEVAPGVRQTVWTFGGTAPGPTLRGHVGDTFEITLVNDGSMGHGIDFHAGALAPDEPMRTIEPGESLVYRFTATHSGAWLYHCSTMPMLEHIANGMYGAVIIDPPGLAPVDHEYVLVGSELYLGPQDGTADPAKLRSDSWDAAVFNGYPDQYVHAPLRAKAGERVRFWVVAAGPVDGMAFHVVGTQFDTVFKEGAYLLRPDNAEHGAAQVLDLSAAQGGFVETVFPEPGHYALVDHDMRRGENGARGIVEVGR